MNNTVLVKGSGLYVGLLFALVAMKLPDKATHTSIKPRWWHRNLRHELRVQNVTPEELVVMQYEFATISKNLSFEIF